MINVHETINSGQVFLWKVVHRGQSRHWYGVNGQDILQVDEDTGRVRLRGDGGSRRWCKDTGDWFRSTDEIGSMTGGMPRDRITRDAMRRYGGLRVMRQDPYQCMISFITSANSNIGRITGNLCRIAETFGRAVSVADAGVMHLFPEPRILASASIQEIRGCGVGYRARYIKEASEMVASGAVDFERIKDMDGYYDALDEMLRVPGVGCKVADCIMLFSLERLDAFPLDRWMLRVLEKYYGGIFGIPEPNAKPQRPASHLTYRQYRDMHEKIIAYFGPHAGYAQQWLFKMARDGAGASWLKGA